MARYKARKSAASKKRVPAAPKQRASDTAWRLPGVSPVVKPWPKGYRSACLFTFNVDCEVTWMFKQSTDPIAMSMGQIEPQVAMPMLLSMLTNSTSRAPSLYPAG